MPKRKTLSKSLSPAALLFADSLSGVSESTRNAYRYALAVFEHSGVPIDNDVMVVFSRWMERRRYAKATSASTRSLVGQYLIWLDANEKLPDGVTVSRIQAKAKATRSKRRATSYRKKKPEPELPRVVTYYDALPRPDDPALYLEWLRNRAIMHTLYASGGRVSEIAKLTRSQVASGRVSEVLITGKGDKQRMLMLTSEAQAAIRSYCDARQDLHESLFIAHRRVNGKAVSRATIWKLVKDACRAQGISLSISPHTFRHYRATQLLNEGMPLESVQMYLGHASPETTRVIYAHTDVAVLRDQLAEYGIAAKDAGKS